MKKWNNCLQTITFVSDIKILFQKYHQIVGLRNMSILPVPCDYLVRNNKIKFELPRRITPTRNISFGKLHIIIRIKPEAACNTAVADLYNVG